MSKSIPRLRKHTQRGARQPNKAGSRKNDVGMEITGFCQIADQPEPIFEQKILTKRRQRYAKTFKKYRLKFFFIFFPSSLAYMKTGALSLHSLSANELNVV